MSMDPIISKIFVAGKCSYIYELAFGYRENVFIFGGKIIEILNGIKDENTDIDVLSKYPRDITDKFSKENIDVKDFTEYTEMINKNGLTVTNSILLSESGFKHLSEIPEIAKDINLKFENPIAEREWALNNIKNKKFCIWSSMRRGDLHHFKNWKIIDPVECAKHGIFTSKI